MILTPLQGLVIAVFGGSVALMALGFYERRRLSLMLLLTSFLVGEFLTLSTQYRDHWLFQAGQRRQSLSIWRDTVNKSPQKMRTRVNLAYALQINNEFESSIQEYGNASRLSFKEGTDPLDAKGGRSRVASGIGQILIRTGRYQEAGQILANAWNQDPGFPGLGANLAFVLLHDNRPDLALIILERTIADAHLYLWFNDLGSLYYNEARAFEMLGRCEESLAVLALAKKTEPDFSMWPDQSNCKN